MEGMAGSQGETQHVIEQIIAQGLASSQESTLQKLADKGGQAPELRSSSFLPAGWSSDLDSQMQDASHVARILQGHSPRLQDTFLSFANSKAPMMPEMGGVDVLRTPSSRMSAGLEEENRELRQELLGLQADNAVLAQQLSGLTQVRASSIEQQLDQECRVAAQDLSSRIHLHLLADLRRQARPIPASPAWFGARGLGEGAWQLQAAASPLEVRDRMAALREAEASREAARLRAQLQEASSRASVLERMLLTVLKEHPAVLQTLRAMQRPAAAPGPSPARAGLRPQAASEEQDGPATTLHATAAGVRPIPSWRPLARRPVGMAADAAAPLTQPPVMDAVHRMRRELTDLRSHCNSLEQDRAGWENHAMKWAARCSLLQEQVQAALPNGDLAAERPPLSISHAFFGLWDDPSLAAQHTPTRPASADGLPSAPPPPGTMHDAACPAAPSPPPVAAATTAAAVSASPPPPPSAAAPVSAPCPNSQPLAPAAPPCPAPDAAHPAPAPGPASLHPPSSQEASADGAKPPAPATVPPASGASFWLSNSASSSVDLSDANSERGAAGANVCTPTAHSEVKPRTLSGGKSSFTRTKSVAFSLPETHRTLSRTLSAGHADEGKPSDDKVPSAMSMVGAPDPRPAPGAPAAGGPARTVSSLITREPSRIHPPIDFYMYAGMVECESDDDHDDHGTPSFLATTRRSAVKPAALAARDRGATSSVSVGPTASPAEGLEGTASGTSSSISMPKEIDVNKWWDLGSSGNPTPAPRTPVQAQTSVDSSAPSFSQQKSIDAARWFGLTPTVVEGGDVTLSVAVTGQKAGEEDDEDEGEHGREQAEGGEEAPWLVNAEWARSRKYRPSDETDEEEEQQQQGRAGGEAKEDEPENGEGIEQEEDWEGLEGGMSATIARPRAGGKRVYKRSQSLIDAWTSIQTAGGPEATAGAQPAQPRKK